MEARDSAFGIRIGSFLVAPSRSRSWGIGGRGRLVLSISGGRRGPGQDFFYRTEGFNGKQ